MATFYVLLALAGCLQAATTIIAGTEIGPVRSTDGGVTWQLLAVNVSTGLLSGQPTLDVVAVDPKTPSTWYAAGTSGGTYGFYKTVDSGRTWSGSAFVTFRPALSAGSIVFDPLTTNVIYMLATDGTRPFIAKSTDSGVTWTRLKLPNTTLYAAANFPDGTPAHQVIADPRISGLVYAVSSAEGYVFKSTDFGVTWRVLTAGVEIPDGKGPTGGFPYLTRFDVDPRSSQILYASGGGNSISTACKVTAGGGQCGLYKSVDGGATWTQTNFPAPGSDSLSVDPVSGTIYVGATLAGTGNTVSKSTDGGVTWTPLKNATGGSGGPLVRIDPNNPTTVYAFGHLGFGQAQDTYFRSTDSGATWTTMATPHLCPLDRPNCGTVLHNTLYDLVIVPPAPAGSGPPATSANGVVNGASFQPGIVPNSWATIQGTNLASTTDDWSKSIVNGQFPTTLDGVGISIAGKPAYIYYITPTQINFLVPDIGLGPVPVTVTNNGQTSATVTVTASQYAPAFFLWPGSQAVATRQDFSLAVRSGTFAGVTAVAAKPGDTLILWGTGFGPTSPAAPPGTAVPGDRTYSATVLPTVSINNVSATVYGAALASGFAGLYQVAIQVPPGLADGDWPIQAAIGGIQSPTGVILSVHR